MTLVAVDPGAPLPPEVPPWAWRCDVVEKPDLSPRLKPWVVGLGAAGTVGSAVTLAFFSHWGMAPLPLSLAVLWYGLRRGITTVITPSPEGAYLAFKPDAFYEDDGLGGLKRGGAMVGGLLALLAAAAKLMAEERDWEAVGLLGPLGLSLLFCGLTGRHLRDADAPVPPASPQFRALADPTRPLGGPPPAAQPEGGAEASPSHPPGAS